MIQTLSQTLEAVLEGKEYAPGSGRYADLWAALRRLDSLLEGAIATAESIYGPAATHDPFRGLHISLEEVTSSLQRAPGLPLFGATAQVGCVDQSGEVSQRLAGLARAFALSPFDIDALLICLAPELDLRYERLYAYLQDDVTRKRPSVDLVLNLLSPTFEAKLAARARFTQDAPLIAQRLLHLFDDPAQPQPPLLSKYLKVDERIASYLLGSDVPDARLAPYARLNPTQTRLEDVLLPAEVKRRLALLARDRPEGESLVFYFQGPYGVGKQMTAAALCRESGLGLLAVDGERLAEAGADDFAGILRLAGREARLQGAALYWEGFDALLADERRGWLKTLLQELERGRQIAFLAGNTAWEPADVASDPVFLRVEFPRPSSAERVRLWRASLDGDVHLTADVDLQALAGKFRFSGGQIRDAVATARALARWRDPDNGHVGADDLYTASRLQSNRKLATLARKITPHYKWDDIVLPADRLRQLREICNTIKYRALVYDEWGFDGKLALGKGLNVLFAGPSGTGKTMAAEIIAGELGLDLYKIDLSTVVSKYIGETEKNLARIFAEAETSNAILFFDEADALFGKRSEVRDAHDRYANIEISYLLQKMEEYEGVVILATNLRKNMDDAFVRRIHATVEFPFPAEHDRRRIWDRIWPDVTPRSPDLDLDFMARRFEIAGGNIKNVALSAAFLAASDGRVVNMTHLVRAVQREYQKMGKVVVEGEFGPYAGLTQ